MVVGVLLNVLLTKPNERTGSLFTLIVLKEKPQKDNQHFGSLYFEIYTHTHTSMTGFGVHRAYLKPWR